MVADNSFVDQGITYIKAAVAADEKGDYDNALTLYQDGVGRVAMAIKYERNESRKNLLMERCDGWLKRAEELKDQTGGKSPQKNGGASPAGGGKEERKENGSGSGSGKADDDRKEDDEETDNDEELSEDDKKLRGALDSVVVSEKPNVKWDDVAGLDGAKESLKEAVIMPVKFPQLFTGERRPFKGILLFGPPGTGKSLLAKAVATESDSTFFSVSSADLISKWQGESERLVRNLFEMARESKSGGRSIIFIDEVDSLCGSRSEGENDSSRRVKTEFLVQMDGVGKVEGGVLVLGATNVPWDLDAAIRRRFEKRIYLPLPSAAARTSMLKLNVDDTPNSLSEKHYEELGKGTDGASGSDLEVMTKEALMEPLRRCVQARQFIVEDNGNYVPCQNFPNCHRCPPRLSTDPPGQEYTCKHCSARRLTLWEVPPENLEAPPVTIEDFQKVMGHAFTTVSNEELKRFEEWTAQFGQEGG
mmetsp:Transcript_22615/g.65094  ORF Transcript_22615/g.65094 Transcript_22615/m.65094 type:complete len:475 (+) Transcript_22615:132-1556(+)